MGAINMGGMSSPYGTPPPNWLNVGNAPAQQGGPQDPMGNQQGYTGAPAPSPYYTAPAYTGPQDPMGNQPGGGMNYGAPVPPGQLGGNNYGINPPGSLTSYNGGTPIAQQGGGRMPPIPVGGQPQQQQQSYPQAPPTGLIGAEQALGGGLRGALGILEQGASRISNMGGGGGYQQVSAGDGGLSASRGQGLGAINSAINSGIEGLQGFVDPGQQSQQQQAALSGALGPEAQQAAYAAFNSSPGQQWLQEQGMRQVTRGASATGGLGGGRVQEELMRQGQGLAQQDFQNQFNNLGQVTGQGLSAAQNIGQLRGQQAGASGSLIGQLGSAQASLAGQEMSANAGLQASAMQNQGANQRAQMSALTNLAGQGSNQAFDTGMAMSTGRLNTGQQIANSIGSATSALSNLQNQQGANIASQLQALGLNQANVQSTAGSASAAELANLAALLGNISQGQASTQAGLPAIGGFVQPDNTQQNIGNLAQTLGGIYGAYQQSQQPPATA